MVKNKYIILPFLLLAWTIIFAHSIIPHHHFEEIQTEHKHSHSHSHHHHEHTSEDALGFNDCDDDCNDHVCHFHVEILTQVSLDNILIPNTENTLYTDITCIETNNYNYYKEFVSDQIPKTDHLRGPPTIA